MIDYQMRDGVITYLATAADPRNPTAQEQADALAAIAAEEDAAAAIAGIYAPVTYNGKQYPADLQSLAKYEVAKQARGRGALNKGVAIATDGTILKLSNAAAIDAFHAAIEAEVTARIEAIHDQLP